MIILFSSAGGARGSLLLLLLGLETRLLVLSLVSRRAVVDEQRVDGEGLRQDVVADVRSSHGELVELDGVLALNGHLNVAEVRVHSDVHSDDRAAHERAVLELERDRPVLQLHQKPN